MCGFIVYQSENLNIKKFETALNLINHRGPDHFQTLKINDNLVLGFRRLSIIDLNDRSHQPFKYKDLIICFNGEIYNFIEIKKELTAYGIKFKTKGDTEVVAASINYWGIEKASQKFLGMWSIFSYNKISNEIFISRDRFGIKPLYYFKSNKELIFSSEIKPILKITNDFNIDMNISNLYLNYGISDTDENTFFKNIKVLPPSHYAKIDRHINLQKKKYWQINENSNVGIEDQLTKTFNYHKISDVNIAVSLSGGVDSSTMAYFYKNENFNFYSLKIKNFDNEINEINDFKNKYKINHKFVETENYENLQSIDQIINMTFEPFQSAYPIYALSIRNQAKDDNCKILMTGDGADEVFAGYDFLKKFLKIQSHFKNGFLFNNLKYVIKNIFSNQSSDLEFINENILNFTSNKKITMKSEYEGFQDLSVLKRHLINRLLIYPMQYWLKIEDKISMNFSIENRVPFLNHNLIESVFTLDDDEMIKDGISKYPLKKIAEKYLPRSIVYSPKKQRPALINKNIFNNETCEFIIDEIESNDLFNTKKDKILREFKNDLAINNLKYWFRLLTYLRWKKIIKSSI
jgi:asparagine synthase (glutamine-hydrolysing)